ncbi:MAG: biotin-dependent carboxyltransferase family protein [Devosia sp.]
MSRIRMTRAGPLTTLQDAGRPGLLAQGVSASGPMDRGGFERAGVWLGGAGRTGIEFTSGIAFEVEAGTLAMAADGGGFGLEVNGKAVAWPARAVLRAGDTVEVRPGGWGNWGYLRFGCEVDVEPVLGSRSTNSVAGLGKALAVGDTVAFGAEAVRKAAPHPRPYEPSTGPIRVLWGLHADLFEPAVRRRFVAEPFRVSAGMDRMGIRLEDPGGVFREQRALSLVSDAIVPGDLQILGDGTPIVLMRDHQPTGGYPRIATVASADLDRFAQLRPGTEVRFEPVTLAHARGLKP